LILTDGERRFAAEYINQPIAAQQAHELLASLQTSRFKHLQHPCQKLN
jgi:hypothetical protein